jgi:hypothetical protein
MKLKIIIPIAFMLSINLYSEPFVNIYKTHDNGLYGRSINRDVILSVKDTVFKRYSSVDVKPEHNFITSVVLDSLVVKELENRLENRDFIQIGFVRITKIGNIYHLEDDNIFLDIKFSLEKPDKELIAMVEGFYGPLSKYSKIVGDRYRENYVIRIHRAVNLIDPEVPEITYDEALIMATILGDRDQWLWGIHDGTDYLKNLLFD